MIQIIATVCLGCTVVGALLYLLVCVDANSKGVLSSLRRIFLVNLPSFFQKVFVAILGERITQSFSSVGDYLVNTNHPLVQYFYLLIMWIDWYFLMFYGVFLYIPSSMHVVAINILFVSCLYVYYKACKVGPGEITKYNQGVYIKQFSYDNVVYREETQCKTCKITKPAKSKHCSVCKMCVAKFDHHCIWVRQCVGLHNYKYFLSFIGSHTVVCLYAAYLGWAIIQQIIHQDSLYQQVFIIRATQETIKATTFIVYKYIFHMHIQLAFATILTFVMGVTLFFFFAYHLYLVNQGLSTAEKLKRSDIISYTDKALSLLKTYLVEKKDRNGIEITKKQLQLYEKEFKQFTEEKEILQSYKSKGFIQNIKEIFRQ